MINNFFQRWLLFFALFASTCLSKNLLAQSIANYNFIGSPTGSLEDLSTGATSLLTGNLDDNATVITPIGFNFPFMGTYYSHFSANSNGQVLLNATGTGTAISPYSITAPAANTPYLFPMAGDNEVNGGIRYKVIGTAPNRIFVLEWTQFYVYWTNINNAGNMQLWLHETTGVIEYVYGEIYNTSSASVTRSIGLSSSNTATTAGYVTVAAVPSFTPSATFTTNTFAPNTGGTTATPLIANLGSNAQGSRWVYTFTPAAVAAPTDLTFSSVTATGMTLNWTDNTPDESGFRVYRSLDGVTYTQVAQLAPNTTSYTASSLNTNTLYYWKVVAYKELESDGLLGTESTLSPSLAGGIKTVGAGGDYENLTTAFADINAQGLTGDVELQLIAGYPAAPETYPILSCNANSTGAFSVKVYPTVSGLSITSNHATGTLLLEGATNLTFDGRINQTGPIDLVISNTNVGASYAIQFVNDASLNTLQYLTIQSANNSTSSGTIVFAGSTGTTGNDNNLIDHCDIGDAGSTPLNAIYSAGTSTTVDNSGNIISNSNIYNYFGATSNSNGIFLSSNNSGWTINSNKFYQTVGRTPTGASQHRGINIVTSSGSGYIITNNVIGYADASGTGLTTYSGAANRFFGIELTASNNGTPSSIQGNTIAGIQQATTSGTTSAPGVFTGISVLGGTVSIGDLTPNIIGLADAPISVTTSTTASIYGIHANSSGTLVINNNTIGAITGTGSSANTTCNIYAINSSGSGVSTTISGNTIGGSVATEIVSGTTGFTTASATISGIETGAVTTLTVTANTISNLKIQGASGTINGVKGGTSQFTWSYNTIHDLAIPSTTGSSSSNIYGFYNLASPTLENITDNLVYNLSVVGSSTSTSGVIAGIHTNTTSSTKNFSGNTIYGLSFANSSTGTSVVNGISSSLGTTVSVFKNKVYDLSATGTGSTVNGVLVSSTSSGTSTVNIYNNVIGDLKAPTASALDPVRGISITSTTSTSTYQVYYNSIYLNASSTGTNFGASGVYHTGNATATTASLDLRNNIIINESTPSGTGIVAAFRRSSTSLANFISASNRNLLYAGVPAANRLIMYDGTNSYQTIAAYQGAVAPRETSSITGETTFTGVGYGTAGNFFISTTSSDADYLKPMVGIATQVESGGENITSPAISDDYAGEVRQGNAGYTGTGTAPDLGAFEFEGEQVTPIIVLNSVTPPIGSECTATPRVISVEVTSGSSTITSVSIEYAVDGVAQSGIVMTNVSGSTWEGTIPVPTPSNATIAWNILAQNSLGLYSTFIGTAYSDEPLVGAVAEIIASDMILCEGGSTELQAQLTKTLNVPSGTGTTTVGNLSTGDPTTPLAQYYESQHTQYLVLASDLTAAGLTAGSITNIAYTVTNKQSTKPFTSYTIKLAPTSLTSLTNGNNSETFTTVYVSSSTLGTGYSSVTGLNSFAFGTGPGTSSTFEWDGTSNILVDICFTNDPADNGNYYSQNDVVSATTKTYTATYGYYRDDASICGVSYTSTSSSTKLPNFIFTGNGAPAIQSISWSDGVGVIGTDNPLMVNPTTTTTYTATITASGCTVSPEPTVTVTVNSLPTTPNATNSTQCGVQIPTASVESTSGLPTPTFNWYATATGGTVLQSSTSTTYETAISSTTTFYVSEENGVCSSERVPVTVTVTTSPAISISGVATVCEGESTTLTVSSTNDPDYSYTWSDGLGTGTTVTASPLVTTTYTVTAVDTSGGTNDGCMNTATYEVVVNPIPTSVVASVSDPSTCLGESVDLISSAVSNSVLVPVTVLNEDFNSGLGTWTTTASGTATLTAGFAVQNAPFTYTTYFTNFTTSNGGGFVMANADLTGSGNKIRTTLVSPSFSTVGMTSANLTFENLYQNWSSGDSLVRLEISTNGGTTWSTLKDYLPLGSQGVVTFGSQVAVNENISLASYLNQPNLRIRFNYVTTWGYYWIIDNVVVSGLQQESPTYSWISSPTGFTSSDQNPIGVQPTANTTYTVTVTNSYGCSNSASVAVTVNEPTSSNITLTECTSYTWPVNGTTYNTSGVYTATIPNAVGCDSIITLNLTINQPSTSIVTVTTCEAYTWAQNGQTYTTSGLFHDTIPNAVGCDSVITLDLTITPFVVTATDNGDLTITASTGTTYQWIDCTTDTPIAGATSQTFTATANGSYAVIVSNGTCSDTSNCVTISTVDIKENTAISVNLYPNPTQDEVYVTMSVSEASIEVFDTQGKLLQFKTIKSGDVIHLGEYERGVYSIRVKTDAGNAVTRVVKQ